VRRRLLPRPAVHRAEPHAPRPLRDPHLLDALKRGGPARHPLSLEPLHLFPRYRSRPDHIQSGSKPRAVDFGSDHPSDMGGGASAAGTAPQATRVRSLMVSISVGNLGLVYPVLNVPTLALR